MTERKRGRLIGEAVLPDGSAPPRLKTSVYAIARTLDEEGQQFLREIMPPLLNPLGKFRRGHLGGPGRGAGERRDRVVSFRKLVCEYVERAGGYMEDVVIELFEDLMEASDAGDTSATKLLLDRLCGKEAEQLEVTVASMSDTERAVRLHAILENARRRITVESTKPAELPGGPGAN